MKKGEIVLSAFCLAFFLFLLTEAFQLRGEGRTGEVGSGFWPLLSLTVTTVLSLAWLIGNLRRYRREQKGSPAQPPTTEAVAAAWGRRKKIALCSICLLGYIILTPLIGFILSTVLAMEEKRKAVLILSPPVITAVVFVVFIKFIMIRLPKGVGVFVEFSRLFY
jgi:hypothetical protein